jgi:hypothetical protein
MPSIRLADIPNAGPQGVAPDSGIIAPRVAQLGGSAALDPNAMRGVAKDMQLEKYNLNAFAGEAIGLGKIGDAMSDVATLGLRFATKMADAKENDDETRADTLMRIALEKQANDQDMTPVEKWQEKWASNVADTRKKISEIGMSKNTFAKLSPAMDRWAELSKVKIEGQANQKRIEGYRMNTKANALIKMASDDYEGAFTAIDEGVKKGVFSEEQGKLEKAMMQDDIIRKAELKQRENITSEILTDPRRAKEILTKAKTGEQTEFGKLDPSRVKLHLYEADRQIRVTDSDNWNSLVERIQNGDIASKEDLKKEAEGKQIDPGKYKRLESAIAANIQFDPKVAGDLKAKVAAFDFSADKNDEKFYALNAEIASKLPKEHAQLLGGELNSSWKKAFDGTPKSPREVYRSDVIQGIKRIGDSGLLGETGLDKDGKIEDLSKNNTYNARVYSVMQGMDAWFDDRANKDKTPADAQQHRDSLIEPLLKGKALELFKGKAPTLVLPSTPFQTGMMGGVNKSDFAKPTPTPPPAKEAIDRAKAMKPEGKVTYYNFPGDAYSDSNSRARIGAWDNKLTENSLAISPDIESKFKAAGIGKGEPVELTLADGSTVIRNWDDRTMQDKQAIEKFGKPLRGRFDFHSPGGKQKNDGMAVLSFRKAPNA